MVKHIFLSLLACYTGLLFFCTQGLEADGESVHEKLSIEVLNSQEFKVLRIFDGDTILAAGKGVAFKIRLAGIDSPEIGYEGTPSQPFAKAAKKNLDRFLKNRTIRLKTYGTGGYNRLLAEIFTGGKNINLKMVQDGFAEVYRGRRPESFDSGLYFNAEKQSKKLKKGMWAQGSSYQSPRHWRKDHPKKF